MKKYDIYGIGAAIVDTEVIVSFAASAGASSAPQPDDLRADCVRRESTCRGRLSASTARRSARAMRSWQCCCCKTVWTASARRYQMVRGFGDGGGRRHGTGGPSGIPLGCKCDTMSCNPIQTFHLPTASLRMPLTEHPGRVWTNNYESQ